MLILLRILLIAVGLLAVFYLLADALRNKRRLDRRIVQFREEQEASGGAPPDPYAALAELYAEDERGNRP